MKFTLASFFLQTIFCIAKVKGARILCAFPATSVSHQVVFQQIWKELALQGHEVTVLTPNPLNDPSLTNLKEIDLSQSYEVARNFSYQSVLSNSLSLRSITRPFYYMYSVVVMSELNNPEVQALIADRNVHFDLLVVQYNLPTMHALSERFNCPMVGISVSALFFIGPDLIGNSPHLALNPDVLMQQRQNLKFFDRVVSILYTTWHRFHYHNTVVPREDAIAKRLIRKTSSYLGTISSKVSLLLLNANSLTYTVRPTLPAMIDVDHLYRKNNRSLPTDLQEELDNAKDGFIYFSLGSNLRSTNISVTLRNKIMKCFAELPYTFLWKWEDDRLPEKPRNILIRKWFPQVDILAHPNIKAFLMQGGIQSIDEAIAFHVPLIAMPIYLDQFSNTDKIVRLGIAKSVNLFEATKEEIRKTILEVVENPIYKRRIKEVAKLVSDVPLDGLNKTIWWIEYVIRHKGAALLRSSLLDLKWYQECLLDIIGFFLIFVCFFFLILYKICFKLFKI